MEDTKGTTEETSVPPPPTQQETTAPSQQESVAPPETVTTAAEATTTTEKEDDASVKNDVKPSSDAPESAPAPAPAPAPTSASEESTPASAKPPAHRSSSRRSSGVSGIAHRVHRETRSPGEARLPSRFSDFEVESPRQSQGARATRQRSNESLKKGTPATPATTASAPTTTKESTAKTDKPAEQQKTETPEAAPVSASTETVKPSAEVDPADELEMMLMSSGAIPTEPPAKKAREDNGASAPGATSSSPKKSTTDKPASSTKKSKSKRKSLVEGREARVVKPKFSLEQEMSLSDELQKCLTLLNGMFRQDECAPFYYAVDPIRLNIPDYWDVIKQPMDMSKIKENLLSGKYTDSKQFVRDIHLMFENARTYNPVGHPVHTLADRLEKSFEEQMAKLHIRRTSPAPASPAPSSGPSAGSSSKATSRPSSSSSKKSRLSQSRTSAASSSESSSSSGDSSSSDGSSDYSNDDHKKKKGKHHSKHHHHHHRHGKKDKAHGKKRSRQSSGSNDMAAYEESIRRAELEKLQKLQNEVRLLKNQLLEQKQNKAKAASIARAEKAAAAAARRVSKTTSKRPPLSFDTTPDPDRPVTEEDKRRISGNINRLPPERMLPLVSFVQDQIPALSLVIPGRPAMIPSEIEVDLDTLDNRTLRTVDHKVRQALALAGQARRRAERRLLEMQMQKEHQYRHHATLPVEQHQQQQRVVQAKSSYQSQLTSQQMAMNYVDSLRRGMSAMSPSPAAGFQQQEMPLPGTPGSGQSGGRSNSEMDDTMNDDDEEEEEDEEDETIRNEIIPNLPSDSESSSSSSSSSDSEGDDDMIPVTYAPPPIPGGAPAAPVSLSQATALTSNNTGSTTATTITGSS